MTKQRGRPRDPSRDRAILVAARKVIAECGYTGATMEAIAATAGVGKDTLYRRWSSKEQLALEVVDTVAREVVHPSPLDPDPRLNLFLFVKDIVRLNLNTDFGSLVAGLVGEAGRNPELATHFRDFWERRRAIAATLVRDVVGPAADAEEVETILDALLGPIYYRLLLTGAGIDDEYLWKLIAAIPWHGGGQDAWAGASNEPTTQQNQSHGSGDLAGAAT